MNTIKLVTWSFSSFGALLIRLVGWVILLFSVYVHLECAMSIPYKNGTSYAVLL